MLYSKENYETYFGIVKTLQGMDGNATYDEILEEEEAIDYMPVLERVEAFMEDNGIEE